MQAHSLSNRAASRFVWNLVEPEGLAHDAGNLLNALGLYCDLLEAPEVLRAEHRHYVVELRGIARRSAELLGQLGVAEKTHGMGGGLERLRQFEGILRHICAPESVFSMEIEGSLQGMVVDVEVVERILLNLVRNASEAIGRDRRSGGEVTVLLRGQSGELLLRVEDNGPGMDPLTAARFVQPQSRAASGGRGLGHRILHGLAQDTGASFEMTVRPGLGSVFTFRWKADGESSGSVPPC